MASRRKRGPVAFRPRLLAGLVLSLQLLSIVEDRLRCRIFNSIGTYSSGGNVRFGSLAAPQDSTILRSVYGLLLICKQAVVTDMVRLHTYIRPPKSAYVDAGP